MTGVQLRIGPLTAVELRTVAWALPPLLVLALAHGVFDLVARAYADLGDELIGSVRAGSPTAAVIQAGFGWAATALVYVVVAVGSCVAAVSVVRSRVRAAAARPFRRLASVVVAIGLGHLALVDALGLPLRAVFDVTLRSLDAGAVLDPQRLAGVRVAVALVNVLSVVATALVLTAAAATTLPPVAGWNEAGLVRRTGQVKEVVAMAAAFMVAGVLHMGAWTHWPDALVPGGELGRLATGVTLYWGAAFTLMIAAFYLPMATVLRRLADVEMDRRGIDLGDRARWLADRGLSFQVGQQLPQLAAMAAPLMAAPLSEALRVGVSQLGF